MATSHARIPRRTSANWRSPCRWNHGARNSVQRAIVDVIFLAWNGALARPVVSLNRQTEERAFHLIIERQSARESRSARSASWQSSHENSSRTNAWCSLHRRTTIKIKKRLRYRSRIFSKESEDHLKESLKAKRNARLFLRRIRRSRLRSDFEREKRTREETLVSSKRGKNTRLSIE